MMRVLLVDDEREIRENLKDLLTLSGFSVQTANNGREALERLRAGPGLPDVIILDLLMPVMTGEEFLSEFAKNPAWRGIRVFVFSGVAIPPNLSTKVSFLPKPVDSDQLIRVLQRGQLNEVAS